MNFKQQLNKYVDFINYWLEKILPLESLAGERVCDAMKYSLTSGGKRLRPVLTLAVCDMFGGKLESAVCFACAVEYIHVGSLIHDDLPCMDDDDLRRGKPSCHIMYDEATAVLAGDGFFLSAFEILTLAKNFGLDDAKILKACGFLSKMSSFCGMVGGQDMDMLLQKNGADWKKVEIMNHYKTSSLIQAACCLGAIAAGASESEIETVKKYALALGLAFQTRDDILDVVGDESVLGKPIGSDVEKNKSSSVLVLGLEKATLKAQQYTENAIFELNKLPCNRFLLDLTEFLLFRDR